MSISRVFFVLATLWTLTILTVCWMPMSSLANDDGTKSWMFNVPYFDKLVHFGIFMIFAVLWYLAAYQSRPWVKIFTAGVVLAVLTEIVQTLPMIGRQADLDDAGCDILGVAIGIFVIGWFITYLNRQRSPVLA